MAETKDPKYTLAVIADAHFHAVDGDYGLHEGSGNGRYSSVQTWAQTRESSRVFNESSAALDAALAQVAQRKIRHVILLGDYTDNGQRETTERLAARLSEHEAQFGTRFYALPGNHDVFGRWGRHVSRHFLRSNGEAVLVTSDWRDPTPNTVISPAMFCEGYPNGLLPMASHGYFRRPDDLWWESPFGVNDDPDTRTYEVSSTDGRNRWRLMDASYLVEPQEGLWLLMVDANIFEPRSGVVRPGSKRAFIDSTDAGWNAVLRFKPFLIDWMKDLSGRAKAGGKTLLAFSHYPIIDPFDDVDNFEQVLFGRSAFARRKPDYPVAEAVANTGISLHFSGHWHVDGVSRRSCEGELLTNIAVPSLVSYPPAFKLVTATRGSVAVNTIDLSSIPLDDAIMKHYHHEVTHNGLSMDPALFATTYGEFLSRHAEGLVAHRYFAREWPESVVSKIVSMNVADLVKHYKMRTPSSGNRAASRTFPTSDLAQGTVVDLVADWYRLRQAGSMATNMLGTDRLAELRRLADLFVEKPKEGKDNEVASYFFTFFQALIFYLDRAECQKADDCFELGPGTAASSIG